MVNVAEKELKGIIAHLDTPRAVLPVTEHVLEVVPQLIDAGWFRAAVAESGIIGNMPPITFSCPDT